MMHRREAIPTEGGLLSTERRQQNKMEKHVPTKPLPEPKAIEMPTSDGRLRRKTRAAEDLEKVSSCSAFPGHGEDELSDEEDMFRLRCPDQSTSKDPRQAYERKVMSLS
jgi:hypothetical protein